VQLPIYFSQLKECLARGDQARRTSQTEIGDSLNDLCSCTANGLDLSYLNDAFATHEHVARNSSGSLPYSICMSGISYALRPRSHWASRMIYMGRFINAAKQSTHSLTHSMGRLPPEQMADPCWVMDEDSRLSKLLRSIIKTKPTSIPFGLRRSRRKVGAVAPRILGILIPTDRNAFPIRRIAKPWEALPSSLTKRATLMSVGQDFISYCHKPVAVHDSR
jgi:hypothetical protein